MPIKAEDFISFNTGASLNALKDKNYTRVTSGTIANYVDGLANGNYMLDVRQGVTDLPSTSHLECIVHKLDTNYVSILATDLYGNIFTRRKYTDGWHGWEQYAKRTAFSQYPKATIYRAKTDDDGQASYIDVTLEAMNVQNAVFPQYPAFVATVNSGADPSFYVTSVRRIDDNTCRVHFSKPYNVSFTVAIHCHL